jgi:hypothetical protein
MNNAQAFYNGQAPISAACPYALSLPNEPVETSKYHTDHPSSPKRPRKLPKGSESNPWRDATKAVRSTPSTVYQFSELGSVENRQASSMWGAGETPTHEIMLVTSFSRVNPGGSVDYRYEHEYGALAMLPL